MPMGKLERFEIIFDSNQIVFNPGQFINGKCIIETVKEIAYKFLTIKVKGIAKVRIESGNTTLHNSEQYFDYKAVHYQNGIFIYLYLFV